MKLLKSASMPLINKQSRSLYFGSW